MSETLTVRLGSPLAEALQAESRQTGLSKGEIARQAIADRLQRRRTGGVMAKHFGSVRGPADLSTSKKYRRTWSKKRR